MIIGSTISFCYYTKHLNMLFCMLVFLSMGVRYTDCSHLCLMWHHVRTMIPAYICKIKSYYVREKNLIYIFAVLFSKEESSNTANPFSKYWVALDPQALIQDIIWVEFSICSFVKLFLRWKAWHFNTVFLLLLITIEMYGCAPVEQP